MYLKDLNLNKKDFYFLGAILTISLILSIYYIVFNMKLGIYCSDIYVYLLNALYFTGININSTTTISLSPVICFLTSILFYANIKDQLAILIITAIFAIFGNIGLYLLLKTRFNEILSFCGVILYSTFAINLTWFANGSVDIPAVSITIWIVLLAIMAIKANPKFYQILIPAIVIGFFTRYTIILILPVLALYYLYNKGFGIEKDDLKYILKGFLFGLITTAIILIPIMNMGNGYFSANAQISSGMIGKKGSATDLAYNTDINYYLVNFINFISATKISFANRTPVLENPNIHSFIVLAILTIGSLLFIVKNKFKLKKEKIIGIIILFIALVSFNHISSFVTILLVFLGLLLLGKDSENKTGIVMLSWILVYFIFFSYFAIKVNRYIIPTIPPLVYLILASIELIHEKIKINNNIIPIILIALFLIQGFTLCFAFEDTNQFIAPQEMSNYIKSEIPDYENQTIGVYNMRPYHWYLGENVTGIQSNNTTEIESANISYYISDIPKNDLDNFRELKSIDNLYLYKKTI
ncbi:MAG: glycosyltransferase family 39 protein [Methanobrevibacter sp.]|nr:glycosyltransferase family 39 protein [Methanobrevibacter sp.]